MLKFYFGPNAIAVATGITLEEGGVHYEPIKVDLAGGEQTRPEYHKINPKGRVPALATPGGILTETGAILEYLAETAVPGLVPVDPLARARMREVMYYLATTMHVNHAHKMRGSRWASRPESFADMQAKVPETMAASAAFIEERMVGPYIFGEDLTLADPWLFTICRWLEGDGVTVSDYPKVSAFMEAMEARPSVQACRAKGIMT